MSVLRIVAVIFGIGFILAGVAGFIPALTPNNMLLGLFMVDGLHNWVHIISGVIALLAAFQDRFAKLYFQVFGIIYLIVTLAGFFFKGNLLLIHANMADNWLHLVIALIALYFGFLFKPKV